MANSKTYGFMSIPPDEMRPEAIRYVQLKNMAGKYFTCVIRVHSSDSMNVIINLMSKRYKIEL